jgi:hypothetical protein
MTTIQNTTGSKEVRFSNQDGIIMCFYGQNYNGEFQVLDTKDYSSEKRAISWAKKQLS